MMSSNHNNSDRSRERGVVLAPCTACNTPGVPGEEFCLECGLLVSIMPGPIPAQSFLPEVVDVNGRDPMPALDLPLAGEPTRMSFTATPDVPPAPAPAPAPAALPRTILLRRAILPLFLVTVILLGGYLALARGRSSSNTGGYRRTAPRATAEPAAALTATAPLAERKPGQPDPTLTPGHRQDAARAAAGAIPPRVREQVFQSYGIDPADKKQVLVRLIPVALGGTEEPANLFPTTPWFLDLKTRLDKQLADKVSRGELSVEQAVSELKTDWIASAHRHHVRNYGHNDRDAAQQTESKLNW